MSQEVKEAYSGLVKFGKDSARFLEVCEKPDAAGTFVN